MWNFKQVIWFLKLQLYRQHTTFKCSHHKLASRFFGPYLILQRIGQVAYMLQLLDDAHIHPVFHVSLLKKYFGDNNNGSLELPPVADDGVMLLQPKRILDTCWAKQGKRFILELWSSGVAHLQKRPPRKRLRCCSSSFLLWTLRIRVCSMREELISHYIGLADVVGRISGIVVKIDQWQSGCLHESAYGRYGLQETESLGAFPIISIKLCWTLVQFSSNNNCFLFCYLLPVSFLAFRQFVKLLLT